MMSKKVDDKPYFKMVKVDDEVFGLVFGHGVVRSVWTDGFYELEVEYDNHQVVPYTRDGFPGWSGKLDFQTVFYKEDIDLMSYDFTPIHRTLNVKEIIKLRNKKQLEVRCPSGIWQPLNKCAPYVVEEYLENNQLHLFRKQSKKGE